jgi:hypothetical protein
MGAGVACGMAALAVAAPFKDIKKSRGRLLDLRLGPASAETALKPAPLPQPAPQPKPEISLKKEMQEAVSPPETDDLPAPAAPNPPGLRPG